MKARLRRIALAGVLMTLALSAQAELKVRVGQLAADLDEAVMFEVAGQPVGSARAFGDFALATLLTPTEASQALAFGANSGALLAQVDLPPLPASQTLNLVLHRDRLGALRLAGGALEAARGSGSAPLARLVLLRALDEDEGAVSLLASCQGAGLGSFAQTGFASVVSNEEPQSAWDSPLGADCQLDVAGLGLAEVTTIPVPTGLEVLAVVARTRAGGQPELRLALEGQALTQAQPDLAQAAPSRTGLWLDRNRPGQAASIQEDRIARRTSLDWLHFDADGQPAWARMEGVYTAVAGRRDLEMYVYRQGSERQWTASARLVYLDCNQAELRVVTALGSVTTLLLERSLPQVQCTELNP